MLLAECHGAQAENQMSLTLRWISPMKNRRSHDAGRFPCALAAFVKRPQAGAQIGVGIKVSS
jgi:hypothetical protein